LHVHGTEMSTGAHAELQPKFDAPPCGIGSNAYETTGPELCFRRLFGLLPYVKTKPTFNNATRVDAARGRACMTHTSADPQSRTPEEERDESS